MKDEDKIARMEAAIRRATHPEAPNEEKVIRRLEIAADIAEAGTSNALGAAVVTLREHMDRLEAKLDKIIAFYERLN